MVASAAVSTAAKQQSTGKFCTAQVAQRPGSSVPLSPNCSSVRHETKVVCEPTCGVALLSGEALSLENKVVVAASAVVIFADGFHVGRAADPAHLADALQTVIFERSIWTHICGVVWEGPCGVKEQ